jgi:uncharacterized protein YbjT (DUF2867 family)
VRTILVGATGLIGGHLLRLLLDDPACEVVVAFTRRIIGVSHDKLDERLVDFDRPETFLYPGGVRGDALFCCLGTTIKKAGSQPAFRKVDFEYPLAVARAAAASVGQLLVVTSVGADARSRIFYSRVKGELEDALGALPFAGGVKVFRPSMLLGERGESRPAERVASALMRATAPLFAGALRRYRPIDAAAVARAMWHAAREEPSGSRVYEGADLFALATARREATSERPAPASRPR